jgi:radical SAM protein with 4Fe4S-binding SPASM domain
MRHIQLEQVFHDLDFDAKFKLYRKLWRQAGSYEILTDHPLHLDIEVSGKCNLKCEHCFQNYIEGPLGFMDFDIYKDIIDQGVDQGLCAVKLQIRGESFLHPEIFDFIDYAKTAGILDVQITTNCTLLDDEKIDRLFASKLDALIVSVDAHHQDSFDQRVNKDYSSVNGTVHKLLDTRLALGKTRPWIRIRSSIPEKDHESAESCKQRIRDTFPQADIVIVGRLHDFRDTVDSFPDLHSSYCLLPCAYLTQRLAVFWNGDVTTCCMDYNNRFDLGNLGRNTIKEIWNGPKMQGFRSTHRKGRRHTMPICRHCHACVESIDSAVFHDKTPRHVHPAENPSSEEH